MRQFFSRWRSQLITVCPAATLYFGERLFVEGRGGCRRFSGFAELEGNRFSFANLQFDTSDCRGSQAGLSLFADQASWAIALQNGGGLVLQKAELSLEFKRDDWR